MLYIKDQCAAPGDFAFIFEDAVKIVSSRSQSSCLLSSLSYAWAWVGEWDLPISANKFPFPLS